MNTLEFYKSLPKRNLLEAIKQRHSEILNEIKKLRSSATIESFTFNRSEHEDFKDSPVHYIFEISVVGAKEKFHPQLKEIARRNNCLLKKKKGENKFIFFTGMFAEYKKA